MLCYAQLELYCVDADFDWLHNLQIIPRNFCCIFIGFKKKFSTELLNKVNILYCRGMINSKKTQLILWYCCINNYCPGICNKVNKFNILYTSSSRDLPCWISRIIDWGSDRRGSCWLCWMACSQNSWLSMLSHIITKQKKDLLLVLMQYYIQRHVFQSIQASLLMIDCKSGHEISKMC